MMRLVKAMLRFGYPVMCYHCHAFALEYQALCAACRGNIRPTVSLLLPINKHYTLKVFAASLYEYPIKTLIQRKFSEDSVACSHLANLIIEFTPLTSMPVDYLVPIPLHWVRYAFRGYNQASQMAKSLSMSLKKPMLRLLRRNRRTKFQSHLGPQERADNVQNAFSIAWRYQLAGMPDLQGKHVVLVDDLCTTGATLINAAKVIAKYKPASITAVVACRAG